MTFKVKKPNEQGTNFSFRLNKEVGEQFVAIAKAHDVKPGTLARQMVEHCVAEVMKDAKKK